MGRRFMFLAVQNVSYFSRCFFFFLNLVWNIGSFCLLIV